MAAVAAVAPMAATAPTVTAPTAPAMEVRQMIGDLQTQYALATTYHEVLRKETQRAVREAAAARKEPLPVRDEFNKFSCANKNKLVGSSTADDDGGGFTEDGLKDAILAHYLDLLQFDDAVQLVKHVCPHPTRPYNFRDQAAAGSAASSASEERFEFENRIYKYYQRRLIVATTAAKGSAEKYAIILNHDSIGEWKGCIDGGAACDATDLFDFIVYDKGGKGGSANNWSIARPSHKEEMLGDIYAHIANLKRGVFSFYEENIGDTPPPRYVGFHERTDPNTYKFKTVKI